MYFSTEENTYFTSDLQNLFEPQTNIKGINYFVEL